MADSRIVLIANTWHYNSTLMQLISRQYHALPTHCHPCSVSQCHWAGKRKFGELSPIGDTDAPIEFSHQFRQNRQNSTRQNPTLGWKITTRPEWVGNFLHARGFECGTRALYYYHWNSSEMPTSGMEFNSSSTTNWMYSLSRPQTATRLKMVNTCTSLSQWKLQTSGFSGHPRHSGHPGKFIIFKFFRIRWKPTLRTSRPLLLLLRCKLRSDLHRCKFPGQKL